MSKTNKNKLIFIHIPKCAGNSMLQIIYSHIFAKYDSSTLLPHIGSDHQLEEFKAKKENDLISYNFIGGHIPFPLIKSKMPEIISDFFVFTILRDPIDRAISLYQYILQTPNHFMHDKLKDLSFEAYVYSKYYFYDQNFQSRSICGKSDAEKALNVLKKEFDLFGTLDQIDLINEKLCNNFQLDYTPKLEKLNGSKPIIQKNKINEDLLKVMKEKDYEDLILYDFVKNIG